MRGRCLVNGTLVGVALQFTASVLPSGSLLQTGISDNVDSVKHFVSVLIRALRRERHFALVEDVPYQPQGSLVIGFQVRNSVRPMHLFGHNLDHDYYFRLPGEGERDALINYSVFKCTP